MRAVVLTRHGGPEVLRIAEVPLPEPRAGEVRVRIRAIGLNFAEVLSRRGLYGWAPALPYILGMEAFGELDGQPVVVGTQFGTYAEWICVPQARAMRPPRGFTAEECAAFPASYLTAWIGLTEMARLRPSDTLLVTAAAGGLGTAAIQIATHLGARVIGAASASKHDVVRKLGAEPIGYEQIAQQKFNVALELVGGDVFRATTRAVAPMGRVVVGGAAGAFGKGGRWLARLRAIPKIPRLSIFDMLRRSYGVMSFHVGWLLDAGLVDGAWADLVRFVETNEIRPLVGPVYRFDQIAEAHRALESRETTGKVVVTL
ncbi:MAG TPA: zinc-binding dehydrogenase [Thermoanaerobaculia bacterium]